MLCYVKKHRPPVVILENVCGAPWDHVCKEFEGIEYRAKQIRLDTKQFYIPHTRTRGYLVAIEAQRTEGTSDVDIEDLVEKWADGMKSYMQRPASCTLDAFMLPSDDPRIHEGRQRLALETKTSASRRRKEVDWARCEQRHTRCRADEKLGNKRPLTKWDEGEHAEIHVLALMFITRIYRGRVPIHGSYLGGLVCRRGLTSEGPNGRLSFTSD